MFHLDPYDRAVVIDGFENGIGDSPYSGLGNLQCVNIASIPGEVSTSFSTSALSSGTQVATGSVTAVNANEFTYTGAAGLETNMTISFTSGGSYSGFTVGTNCYWVRTTGASTFKIYTTASASNSGGTEVTVTGTGTANFTVYTMARPKYFANNAGFSSSTSANYFLVDSMGLVWTDFYLTKGINGATGSRYWVFLGNSVKNMGATSTSNGIAGHVTNDNSHGNGLLYILTMDSSHYTHGYLFVFSNSSIDYMDDSFVWHYGWNPDNPSVPSTTAILTAPLGDGVTSDGWSHEAFVAPDGRGYFCDANSMHALWQANFLTPVPFDPTDTNTYYHSVYKGLLPINDVGQCLAYLGNNVLIGGIKNAVYVWDKISSAINYPILLAENNVQKMVTVNTNTYIFTGNRGRIYITNGSQANLYKKVPDHVSGTAEPYYTWGGAIYNKNQLYFGIYAVTNSKTTNANYGGLWAINVDNGAIRLTNQLSYGSYDGYVSALTTNIGVDPAGAGLLIGWASQIVNNLITENTFSNHVGAGGLDQTSSNTYTNGVSLIDSDLIPIGTFEKPRNFNRVEYLLIKPLVAGESIQLLARTDFSQNFTTIATDSNVGNYTNGFPVNFQNAKWIQLRAILTSTNTTPSYVRLKQLRLTGLME